MVNGKKEGKWVEFVNYEDSITAIDSNSAYFRLVVYKNGKPNGIIREYFYNGEPGNFYGSIYCESTYINGLENGIRSIYHMAGWLRYEIPISNNKENGLEKEYYENGNTRSETKYSYGKVIWVKNYDENGNEIKRRGSGSGKS